MKTQITCRLDGAKCRYFVGKVFNNNGEIIAVHTGKTRSYVAKQLAKYNVGKRTQFVGPNGIFQEYIGNCPKDRD